MPAPPIDQLLPPLADAACVLPATRPAGGLDLRVIGGPSMGRLESHDGMVAAARLGAVDGVPVLRLAVTSGGAWFTAEARPTEHDALAIAHPIEIGPAWLGRGARLRAVAVGPAGVTVRPSTEGGLQPVDTTATPVGCGDLQIASYAAYEPAAALPRAAGATVDTSRLVYGPIALRDGPGGRVIATGPAQWWAVWDVAAGDGGATVVIPHWTGVAWRGWLDATRVDPPARTTTDGGSVGAAPDPGPLFTCAGDLALSWQLGAQRWTVGGIAAGTPVHLLRGRAGWTAELPGRPLNHAAGGSWSVDPSAADCAPVDP